MKTKRTIKFICFALSCVLAAVMLVGCKKSKKTTTGEETPVNPPPANTVVVVEGEYLVHNGASEYTVVIPKNAQEFEKLAAEEFVSFTEQASGVKLPTVTDDEAPQSKFISIGNTSLLKDASITASYDEIGRHGYKISSKDGNMYVACNMANGALYGVYKMLEYYFGYRYYGTGAIKLNYVDSAPLLEFDYTAKPSIDYRAIGTYETDRDLMHRYRLRINSLYDGWGEMYAHTYFKIMPPAKYKDAHSDWYSDNGNLCLTHVDINEFVKNLEEIIEKNPSAPYISVSQEDTFEFCHCKTCNDKVKEWQNRGAINEKAAMAAIMLDFTNKVATQIKAYMLQNHPENADMRLVSFAYNATSVAPIKMVDGEMQLLDENLKAADNLAIMVVPYNSCYNYNFFDEEVNASTKSQLLSWTKATDSMYIWMYDINFDNCDSPFPSWGSLAENYKLLADLGVEYIYSESASSRPVYFFSELKQFLTAELMWDYTQNTNTLIREFMAEYYGEAAGPIYEYFEHINNRTAAFLANGEQLITFGNGFTSSAHWSFGFLNETCLKLFDKAYAAIEHYKNTDRNTYAVLKERINKESLFVRNMLIQNYSYEFNADEYAQMVAEYQADCTRFGLPY